VQTTLSALRSLGNHLEPIGQLKKPDVGVWVKKEAIMRGFGYGLCDVLFGLPGLALLLGVSIFGADYQFTLSFLERIGDVDEERSQHS